MRKTIRRLPSKLGCLTYVRIHPLVRIGCDTGEVARVGLQLITQLPLAGEQVWSTPGLSLCISVMCQDAFFRPRTSPRWSLIGTIRQIATPSESLEGGDHLLGTTGARYVSLVYLRPRRSRPYLQRKPKSMEDGRTLVCSVHHPSYIDIYQRTFQHLVFELQMYL